MSRAQKGRAVVGVLLAISTACTSWQGRPQGPGFSSGSTSRVITSDDIAKWNVFDAYEVLERIGSFRVQEGRGGSVLISQRRGQTTLASSSASPLLVLDGIRGINPATLRNLRAVSILRVEVLGANDATVLYGTGATAGAIIITTRTD